MNWVESFNFFSEIVYLGILVELIIPVLILMNIYKKIAIYIIIVFCFMTAFMFPLTLVVNSINSILKKYWFSSWFLFFRQKQTT